MNEFFGLVAYANELIEENKNLMGEIEAAEQIHLDLVNFSKDLREENKILMMDYAELDSRYQDAKDYALSMQKEGSKDKENAKWYKAKYESSQLEIRRLKAEIDGLYSQGGTTLEEHIEEFVKQTIKNTQRVW